MQIRLNARQKEAVEHKTGPLLIIAGAGTGKTAVITQRIAHLITTEGISPSDILALTFTEKAASEMVERVDQMLPIGYGDLWISTFHSFCDQILRQEGLQMGLDSDYTLMSQAQSYLLFRQNLYDFPLDSLRPLGNPTANIGEILKHFSRLQDEDVTPEAYTEFAKGLPESTDEEVDFKKQSTELAGTYKAYTDLKIASSRLDFGDLIILTLKLFREHPEVLRRYREKFKYILVDEYQDTNYTQNVLVNTLALGLDYKNSGKKESQNANLTVVGDDDQAIYKFRGAAISNILQFKEIYPTAKQVVLMENYRSRQEILDSSYQLIQYNNPFRLEVTEEINKQLQSMADLPPITEDPVQLLIGDTGSEEAELVAKEILRLTGNKDKLRDDSSIVEKKYDSQGQGMFIDIAQEDLKYNFSDIAILVRANDHSEEFIRAMKYYGIPYKFTGPKGLYTRPEVSVLIAYLKILRDYKDEISMFNLLKMPEWGLDGREVIEILRMAKERKISSFEVLEELWEIKIGSDNQASLQDVETLKSKLSNLVLKIFSEKAVVGLSNFMLLLHNSMQQIREGSSTGEILYTFFKSSGFLDNLASGDEQAQFQIQNVSKFFELIKEFEDDNKDSNLHEYVDYLNYSIEIGENPKVDQELLEGYDAVNVMTVHASKGLEFPAVFLVNLVADRFPTRNRTDRLPIPEKLIKEDLPDVKEAQSHLSEERRLFYVGATRARERLYLTAAKIYGDAKRAKKPSIFLDEILNRKVADDFSGKKSDGSSRINFTMNVAAPDDSLDIRDLKLNLAAKVSYTQVSTYERCPKMYKYRYVIGLPSPANATLSFGNSMHRTLKSFFEMQMRSQNAFEGAIAKPTLEDLKRFYKKGWDRAGYESRRHEEVRFKHGENVLENFYKECYKADEQPLQLERFFSYKLDDVLITGSIDRIDLIGRDEDGTPIVDLIDYKTGKVRSEKDVKEDLQLNLYTLVARELFGFKVSKACLFFVEHGVKLEADVDMAKEEELKNKVRTVVAQIRSGDFIATPDVFKCKFCDYNTICADSMA